MGIFNPERILSAVISLTTIIVFIAVSADKSFEQGVGGSVIVMGIGAVLAMPITFISGPPLLPLKFMSLVAQGFVAFLLITAGSILIDKDLEEE